jgi:hypothetical protein
MALYLSVFSKEADQFLPFGAQIAVVDSREIVTVYNDR